MRKQALRYAQTVVACGAVLLVAALALWNPSDIAAFLLCAALAMVASTFKVQLPGMTGTITPAFVFLLVSAGRLSWSETVVIAVLSVLTQILWRPKVRPTALQAAFGAAAVAISGGLAHGVANGLVGSVNDSATLRLAVAGIVLLVCNSLLTAAVLCLIEDAPLSRVWRSIQLWAVPYYLGGGVVAGVWAQANLPSAGNWMLVLGAMSVYLLDSCYRQMVARLAPEGR